MPSSDVGLAGDAGICSQLLRTGITHLGTFKSYNVRMAGSSASSCLDLICLTIAAAFWLSASARCFSRMFSWELSCFMISDGFRVTCETSGNETASVGKSFS